MSRDLLRWIVGRVEPAGVGDPGLFPGGVSGHDREEPLTVGGGTLVASHTLATSGYGGVGVGRSLVAQPAGVSRFDRARPRPGDSGGSGQVFEDLPGGVAFEDAGDLTDGLAFG